MNSSKAKKAKAVSKSRKAQEAAVRAEQQRRSALSPVAASVTGGITPEITAAQIALQTPTVNPYHMMGAMPPNYYNPGNVIGGGYTS